jgi:hypothetical protein
LKICSVMGALLLSLASATTIASNTNYIGTLSYIGTDWYGTGYIFQIHGVTTPCGGSEFSINSSAAGYKEQVATLMLAWSMGGQSLEVTGDATDSCSNGRANIIGIRFYPPI